MTASFLLIEGFDVYPNVNATSYGLQSRWLSISSTYPYFALGFVEGRFGGQALDVANTTAGPGGAGYALTAAGSGVTSMAFGVAHNLQSSVLQEPTIRLKNGGPTGNDSLGVGINAAQQPFLYSGNYEGTPTILATSATPLPTGSWHYLECEIIVATSGGKFTLWVDGVEVLNYTGNTGNVSIDTFVLGPCHVVGNGANSWAYYDDIYVINGSTRLGERRVETLYPASDGVVSWTPATSELNYLEVNETLNDGDSSYVSTATVGNQDLYGISSMDTTPITIDGVQLRISARKDDASTHTLQTALKSGETTVNGTAWTVSDSYLYDIDIHAVDPNTSAAWTAAAVNGAQIGQKLAS